MLLVQLLHQKLIIDLYLVSSVSSEVRCGRGLLLNLSSGVANFGFLIRVVLLGDEDCLDHCLCLCLSEEGKGLCTDDLLLQFYVSSLTTLKF